MSLVITLPLLPMGTVAADGRYAVGPAASWLAGLYTAPAPAAPSVPRFVTEQPASPNVYHSSGAGTDAASGQADGEGGGEGELLAVPLRELLSVRDGKTEGETEALALAVREAVGEIDGVCDRLMLTAVEGVIEADLLALTVAVGLALAAGEVDSVVELDEEAEVLELGELDAEMLGVSQPDCTTR